MDGLATHLAGANHGAEIKELNKSRAILRMC